MPNGGATLAPRPRSTATDAIDRHAAGLVRYARAVTDNCDEDERDRPHLVRDLDFPGAWSIMVNGTEQSWIDPDDPTRLEFDYVQRIADAIDVHAPDGERLRVIHVGGAGMTLARYVAHTRPSSAQIVLEPDADLTERVRQTVPLARNSGIKVRATDGRSGIAAMRDDYADIVIVDAFIGSKVPPELATAEFLADVARVLVGTGTIMWNLTDKAPFDFARRAAAGLAETFGHTCLSAEPATVKGRRVGNIILLGSAAPLPIDALQAKASRGVFPYRLLHGSTWKRFVTGASPIRDIDDYDTPVHGRGMFS